MRILQLSITPMSGLPYRLSEMVNTHTAHESRCIVGREGYGTKVFPHDLVWRTDKRRCEEALEWADVYVMHSYCSARNNPWNIKKYLKPNSKVTAHYSVQPETANKELVTQGVPTTVSAQYHARFFLESTVMPNVMPIRHPWYRPAERKWPPAVPLHIAYSPSNQIGARERPDRHRWATKGYPETLKILQDLVKRNGTEKVRFTVLQGLPLETCLKMRAEAHINIDEVATGSYHNVFLEGLAQGQVSVAYMDPDTLKAMESIVGPEAVQEAPWLNVNLPGLLQGLQGLLDDPQELRSRADACRVWAEKHWDDRRFADLYTRFWETLPPYLKLFPNGH